MRIRDTFKNIINRIWTDLKNYRIAIIVFIIWNIVVRKVFKAFCPFLIFTGFPCAGCGMTRAAFYILTGRFKRGMSLNPSAIFWVIFLVWFFWNRYVRGIYKKRTVFRLGIVCAATLIIYIYRMVNFFPSYPPLVYYRNNIVMRLINMNLGR